MKSQILLLANRVLVPFPKEAALSLKRYTQKFSPKDEEKSCSNFFPSFCAISFHSPYITKEQPPKKLLFPLILNSKCDRS